ncbi:MAG: MBG domain-containing protein, partial [Clostridia bacterium]|nr:MBG domain-containing protein [Clostridia bacterium]
PATAENAASAAGEEKLEVRTMKSGLLDNFERREDGDSAGNFTVSAEQAHSGKLSLKAVKPDGAYGYILQPELLVEREEGGNPYGGYWQNGSVDQNWIDVTGYRYLSFWIYFDRDTENVTFGTGTIEIWNGNDVFNCWLGEKTIPCGSWQRVVIDMTETDILRGDFDSITEQVTKIYFNFNPIAADEIGTFYLDDIELLADVEKPDMTLAAAGEENGTVNAVYSGSPAAIAVVKPYGGGILNISYTGIDGTEYEESETAPTGVGTYRVSISLTGNAFYNVLDKEVTLVIAKAENDFTVSMENFNVGETASEPIVTGNKGGEVTFVYEGTGNTLYEASETVPSAVGTYRVTATVEENENYLAGTASAEFMIVSAAREDVPTQAPVLDASALVLDDSFTLAVEEDTEYRVLNAAGEEIVTWQTDALFTGLEPDTDYTVEARRPAKDGRAPSAAGEQTLRVKTAERFLLDDFEKKSAGDAYCGNFLVSDEKSHSGGNSLKTGSPDGNGYILQPNALLAAGNGYWEAGDYVENYIDITGYRYLSFWIYFDRDAESVTFGNPYTIEMWKESYGNVFTCWLGEKTFACGSWQRVVIDLTQNSILNGDFAEICAHIGKIYFNFNPNGAPDISVNDVGTFYLDDFVLLKGEEV